MTEIKTWGDRLAEIPDGTITTNYHVTSAMQEEIDELRAALAKQGEPSGWLVEGAFFYLVQQLDRITGKPFANQVPLFARPVCPMSDEPVLGTKTWMEGGVVMTQNLTASDIYKPAPMSDDDFISAIEASGIEVENVDAAFAIKRIVELFHDIKGATE